MPSPDKRMGILASIDRLLYHCRPTACTLFMSSACNLRCPNCARTVIGSSDASDMTLPVVVRTLTVYPELTSFTLAGFGEPTLCADFVATVRLLAERKRKIGVITNGTNPEPLLACQGTDLAITISLYGYDRESYRANTGQDAFPEVLRSYERLREHFRHVGFSLVIGRENWLQLESYLQLFDRLAPVSLQLVNHLPYQVDGTAACRNVLTVQDVEAFETLRQQCSSRPYLKALPVPLDPDRPRLSCRSYNYLINVDGDGNIGGCQRQIGPAARFGNLLTMPDPYNSTAMIRLRKRCGRQLIHQECRCCFGNWEEAGWRSALKCSKFGACGKLIRWLKGRTVPPGGEG